MAFMRAAESACAPLTAAMIRRAAPPAVGPSPIEPAAETPPSGWRDDLRLFAITWAAGFVFFLAFIG